jgi:hypothetical protein
MLSLLVAWVVPPRYWRTFCSDHCQPILWIQDSQCSNLGFPFVLFDQDRTLPATSVSQFQQLSGSFQQLVSNVLENKMLRYS